MNVELRCISCILNRGYLQIQEATDDTALQFKTLSAILRFLAEEFKPTANPAYLGTKRDRLIRKITGNPDPYKQKKQLSNKKALEVVPLAKTIISKETSPELQFRKACLSAIVGNIMEFDIPDNPFNFADLEKLIQQAENDLALDEIPQIFNKAKKAKSVLYLTDNAGEIALDTLLVQELKNLGAHVTVAVKDGPILNDATLEDAKIVGMDKVADEVISTGSDAVGLFPNECSDEFLNVYNSVDLVVAKGMGYAETFTELQLPVFHALLLRTKCCTVANHFNVGTGKNIAKLLH
ncbi:MAG: ARMT1-like domain-containing protein [Candidatus Bathyarchaeota archaeon]|nr:ARMT1-like domain-containing protein [Candidatus Bathyarchaeota archaeon]